MRKLTAFAAALLVSTFIAVPLHAQEDCELPSDIDEDERYLILFKGDSKARKFKILDVDGCWVKTFRTDGNHRWHLIKNIVYIGSKPFEE